MKAINMIRWSISLALLSWAPAGWAVTSTTLSYQHEGMEFRSVFYQPNSNTSGSSGPAVLVFPEWWGLNEYAHRRAREHADLGFPALAVDLYGEGRMAKDRSEAASLAKPLFQNRPQLRARAKAALEALQTQPGIAPGRVVATGYCLGGATSLELARTGAPILAAFSFHGALGFPDPIPSGTRVLPVFIFNGKDDPSIPVEAVEKARGEFESAGFAVQVVQYEGAVHSFTNPAAGNDPSRGSAHHPEADRDSHRQLLGFLNQQSKLTGR